MKFCLHLLMIFSSRFVSMTCRKSVPALRSKCQLLLLLLSTALLATAKPASNVQDAVDANGQSDEGESSVAVAATGNPAADFRSHMAGMKRPEPDPFASGRSHEPVLCAHTNPAECDPETEGGCSPYETCDTRVGTTHGCYALWGNHSNGTPVDLKGCWNTKDDCVSETECISKGPKVDPHGSITFFCCCSKSKCNDNVRILEKSEDADNGQGDKAGDSHTAGAPREPSDNWLYAVLYAFVPVCGLALIIFVAYWMYRNCKYKQMLAARMSNDFSLSHKEPLLSNGSISTSQNGAVSQFKDLQVLEEKAKGRFGSVFRAICGGRVVAVKTFPAQDEESWQREVEIYSIIGDRKHPHVLEYLGREVRGAPQQSIYWLITAFHENGSLYDHLKSNELTVDQCFHVAKTMLSGLAYLHEEVTATALEFSEKPCIVHRDFKSKNVLLKTDLTACIADFGLSLKCDHGQTQCDTHGQVGTTRYMAPEVLEGATEFSSFAFRQIDIYAAALVLWELLSRTKYNEDPVGQHKLPFEEEVGSNPRVADVQHWVVTNRFRPALKPGWRQHSQLNVMCTAIEDMWDSEPEARITAGCAVERFIQATTSANGFTTTSYTGTNTSNAGVTTTPNGCAVISPLDSALASGSAPPTPQFTGGGCGGAGVPPGSLPPSGSATPTAMTSSPASALRSTTAAPNNGCCSAFVQHPNNTTVGSATANNRSGNNSKQKELQNGVVVSTTSNCETMPLILQHDDDLHRRDLSSKSNTFLIESSCPSV